MVICFDINSGAKISLDMLMQSREFANTSEAVSMALVNYEFIQRMVVENGQLPFQGSVPVKPATLTAVKAGPGQTQIPEIFSLESLSLNNLPLDEVPASDAINAAPAAWLFGQYNKFLPVKVACRGLLKMLNQSPGGVPLADAVRAISTEAWALGDYLYTLDQASNRPREEAFAAAFPMTAKNGDVSRRRFANQFVGDLRQPKRDENEPRETKFNGLPSALRLITCSGGKNPLLHLSKQGAEFATLPNPILDGNKTPDSKFNEVEIEFILAHIRRAVPEEGSAYNSIADAIAEGANTPDDLDEYLCRKFHLEFTSKAKAENQITKTFLTTQRTGAISRMADLGLVGREKSGLRVTYRTTQTGNVFATGHNA